SYPLTGVEDQGREQIPANFSLSQNYPNPFNPSTTIEFALPHSSFVSLNVFTVLGEKVATLVADRLNAGTHAVHWNATGLPSGVYFYRLEAAVFTQTKRLILLR
ncbi:MAG: T9SS type A sorting domain-containing protein, partial [Bacteroidota bacterium]